MRKILLTIMITIATTIMVSSPVMARTPKCLWIGCKNKASMTRNYCYTHTCSQGGCTDRRLNDSSYCAKHKPRKAKPTPTPTYKKNDSTIKSNKSSGWDSYDKGYEDVWLDDDYDWDRYWNDDDYASGVDDAMDDEDW